VALPRSSSARLALSIAERFNQEVAIGFAYDGRASASAPSSRPTSQRRFERKHIIKL
jgi:hypothetical protein